MKQPTVVTPRRARRLSVCDSQGLTFLGQLVGSTVLCGCMDTRGDNYDSIANVDDGSCIIRGCQLTSASNYDVSADIADNTLCTFATSGCNLPSADNYDSLAATGVPPVGCIFLIRGCTNTAATNYQTSAQLDDGSCIIPVTGCRDPVARTMIPLPPFPLAVSIPSLVAESNCHQLQFSGNERRR